MLKRLLYFFLFSSQIAFSQSANDALMISQNYINGSARMTSMGGAFTSLGGDLSAMQLNPASGAVFLEGQGGISYGFSNTQNDASFYNGGGSGDASYNNVNQIGLVFVIDNTDSYSSIVKYSLGFNYNRTNNYNENISFKGNNNTELNVFNGSDLMYSGFSSIATSFVLSANGFSPDQLGGAENLAFVTYLIDMNIFPDPSDPDKDFSPYYNTAYPEYTDGLPVYVSSAIPNNTMQDYTMNRTGFSGQYNFSFSLDIDNKLYLGASYDRSTFNTSTNIRLAENQFDTSSEVKGLEYNSYVNTIGNGNGFSIGAIYKASDFIRIGATYHSPTWYNMSDEYSYKLSVINKNYPSESEKTEIFYSDYEITTPSKIDAGIAFIFGKNGLISADYEFIDYSSISLGPDNGFRYENEEISNTMTSTHNLKIGTEWKVSFVSLRAGYNYYQTPYKNNKWQSNTQSYSFGTGLNFRSWNLDLAYQVMKRDSEYYIYDTNLVNAANINKTENNFVMTLRFKM